MMASQKLTYCGVAAIASLLDNCVPCIWRFLPSHPI